MAAEPAASAPHMQLPMGVVTRADVGRLAGEAEALDNFLNQAAVRTPGTSVQMPKVSNLFEEFNALNNLNLLDKTHRAQGYAFLQKLRTEAPVVHVSFNTDPSALFLQKLITWIRQQLHPFVLLQIGLNPGIGAGCMLRTTNKFFDFSLRQRFNDQRPLLISKLRDAENAAQPAPAAIIEESAT